MRAPLLKRLGKGPTRPEVADQAATNIHEACDRLERLCRGLSAPGVLDEELKQERLPDPLPAIEIFRGAAASLERRVGVETLMYFGLEAGDDAVRAGLLPLRHWEFLSNYALWLLEQAEQAFALDLADAAAHVFTHAMDLLSRLALELNGHEPPPRPSGPPVEDSAQH